jgi:hypothetical protein
MTVQAAVCQFTDLESAISVVIGALQFGVPVADFWPG